MGTPQLPPQRLATAADAPRIAELMRVSILDLFPHSRAAGFRELERTEVLLPDGIVLAGVEMERPIGQP